MELNAVECLRNYGQHEGDKTCKRCGQVKHPLPWGMTYWSPKGAC